MVITENCPVSAPFYGALGATASTTFACLGAAYGTAKSGVGVSAVSVLKPEFIFRGLLPVIFAGILGIYGLLVSILITGGMDPNKDYTLMKSFFHLGAGICTGVASLGAGMAIGIVGDAGMRAAGQQPKIFVGIVLILIFCEVFALYGLIVGVIMSGKPAGSCE